MESEKQLHDSFDYLKNSGVDVINHWKKLTEENIGRGEVFEVVCKIGDEYELIRTEIPSVIICKAKGGYPIAFFHNHPTEYRYRFQKEPAMSYGDIGWGISNKVPCMCVGADTDRGSDIKCFCYDLSEEEEKMLTNDLLISDNFKDAIDKKNPYKQVHT